VRRSPSSVRPGIPLQLSPIASDRLPGTYAVRTCTPSGFAAGTLTQTVVAVYDGAACPAGVALACNDDSTACNIFGSDRSAVGVNLFDGRAYLIRVGTESATQTGTFYLDIEAPILATNDTCLGATALLPGTNVGSFQGSNGSATTYGCTEFAASNTDVWFTYTGTLLNVISPKEVSIRVDGSAHMPAIYSGSCSVFPPSSFTTLSCGQEGEWRSFIPGNATYYVRVGRQEVAEPALGFHARSDRRGRAAARLLRERSFRGKRRPSGDFR
jgi:hypothetical protein